MLNRRKFVTGMFGATVALPVLESLGRHFGAVGRGEAHAQAMPRKGFVVFVRAGNGVATAFAPRMETERFWPAVPAGPITVDSLRAGDGAQRAVSELADYAPKLNILRGVFRPFGMMQCGHAESIPQCLTAAQVTPGSGNTPLALGESVDWRISRAINPPGREPLTLMAGPRMAYIAEALSWRMARVREPAQRSPLAAYMSLMGINAMPPDVQLRVARARMSVNDLVRGEMNALLRTPALGSSDRQRLQQHFEAVRDTEVRLAACSGDGTLDGRLRALTTPEANDVRPETVQRHMDVIALAFSCGLTHVATLQVGEGNDQTQYMINGRRLPRFHWISHRVEGDGTTGAPIADAHTLHHQVDRLQLQLFKYLLDRLSAYPSTYGTAGATLLDDCAAVWLNDLGNGPPHSGDNVPWILAGSCAGALRTGNYLELGRVTVNQVHNTLLAAAGVRRPDGSLIDDFGDPGLTRGILRQILVAQ